MSRIMGRRCHFFYKEKGWGRSDMQLDITLCRMVGSGVLTEFCRMDFGPHHGQCWLSVEYGVLQLQILFH